MKSLRPGRPVGSQSPRIRLRPSAASSGGSEAVALSSSYGLLPLPWQAGSLDGLTSENRDGSWAVRRSGLFAPRQNGKNGVVEMVCLPALALEGETILHTAHELKTARKAFRRLCGFFDNPGRYPELFRLVKEIRRTNGQEGIYLHNGGSVEYAARTRGSGRGYSVDKLICDEAQEMTDEELAALMPVISASPNPQTIFLGTPPNDRQPGEVVLRLRAAALAGSDPGLMWDEFSIEPDDDFDDEGNWAASNPGYNILILPDTVESERAVMDDETFGRERLGVWGGQDESKKRVIDADAWRSVADPPSQIFSDIAMALDVSPDRSRGSIAFAGRRADGLLHVEVAQNRTGTGWMVPLAVDAYYRDQDIRAVVVDAASPAASLVDELQAQKVPVTVTNLSQLTAACGRFYDLVMQRRIRHTDSPALNASVAAGRKRLVGGRWAWTSRDPNADITLLVAATLATWGVDSLSVAEKPKKRSRVAHFG
jgi:hypothetical protein